MADRGISAEEVERRIMADGDATGALIFGFAAIGSSLDELFERVSALEERLQALEGR